MVRGHQRVARELIEELALHCIKRSISYLTLWAFSTENWNRDPAEIELAMDLFREMLGEPVDRLHQYGIKITTIGDLSRFDTDIQQAVAAGVEKTKDNHQLTLTFALSYGGRDELVRAMRQVVKQLVTAYNQFQDERQINAQLIDENLDTVHLPDPELIIRPGGERRLSGFLPWQSEYSELYFTDVLMPDFDKTELDKALADYAQRQRRFGQ